MVMNQTLLLVRTEDATEMLLAAALRLKAGVSGSLNDSYDRIVL